VLQDESLDVQGLVAQPFFLLVYLLICGWSIHK
jgi:hypothetical protein